MDQDRFRRLRELFEAGLELEPGERAAFVEQECRGDPELRDEVLSLLRREGETGDPVGEVVRRAAVGAWPDLRRQALEDVPTESLEIRKKRSSLQGRSSRISLSSLAPAHLRHVRHVWVYLVAWAFALWALFGTVYWLATVGDTVSVGFTVMPQLLVRTVAPGAGQDAGIRPRDRLLELDGKPILDAKDLVAGLAAVGPGAVVEVALERPDGERYVARLPTERGGSSTLQAMVLLRGAVWVASGLLLFWFHPGRRESWAFLAGTLAVGLPALLPLPDYFGGEFLPVPHLLGRGWSVGIEGLIAPSALWFFLVFPYTPAWLARRKWVVALLFSPALLWAAVFLPTYPWYPNDAEWERPANATYRVLVSLTPLSILVAIGILSWRYRQPHPPKQASQLRALVSASVLSLPLPAITYALHTANPKLLGFSALGPVLALNLTLLLFPPMVAYAIARHDLFEIDRVVARAASYSVALLLVGLLYVGTVALLPGVLAPNALSRSPVLMALVILACIALLRPLKQLVVRRVERVFGRRFDSPEQRLRSLREALRALGDGGLAPAFSRIERLVQRSFGFDRVVVLLPGAGGGWLPAAATGSPPASAIAWGAIELGLERVVPMRVGGEVVGGLGVGRRSSGESLSREDEEVLEVVAQEAARALRRGEPGRHIGGYQVIRPLASGGMGSVYLAVREGAGGFSKRVALKELLPEKAADADLVRRFLVEARVAARLEHPNIVHTYDLGETPSGYFIAMEYVAGMDGGSLLQALERRRAVLPVACAVHTVSCVCLALDFAHTAFDEDGRPLGLVHRDVSPQNVLFSEHGDVKLVDFGVAQLTRGTARAGALVGKVPYMAPEQLKSQPTDHRVDIFATGVLLYELCTGAHPFRKADRRATWDAILRGSFLPPESLRPSLPVELSRVVRRAMAPAAADRFATAAEMAEALHRVSQPELRTARVLGAIVRDLSSAAEAPQPEPAPEASTIHTERPRTMGPRV